MPATTNCHLRLASSLASRIELVERGVVPCLGRIPSMLLVREGVVAMLVVTFHVPAAKVQYCGGSRSIVSYPE